MEPVAAPGLTFKASNVAFQATREGGEHALSRELIKAKMPHQSHQAGNPQQSQESLSVSGTPQPIHAHLATRCPSQGSPESLTDSKMAQGHQPGLPQRNTRSWSHTLQVPCSMGFAKEASNRSCISCQRCFYLRESVVHLGARMAELEAPFGQAALSPRWEPGPCPQTVCSQRKCGALRLLPGTQISISLSVQWRHLGSQGLLRLGYSFPNQGPRHGPCLPKETVVPGSLPSQAL